MYGVIVFEGFLNSSSYHVHIKNLKKRPKLRVWTMDVPRNLAILLKTEMGSEFKSEDGSA